MLLALVPFFPPVILFGAVYLNISHRFLACLAVVTASLGGILFPSPFHSPIARYITGFLSCWFMIWSANLLLLKDATTLKRFQKVPASSCYVWQPLPPGYSWARASWALDLTLNFRAIGWSFDSRQSQHPIAQDDVDTRPSTASGSSKLEISRSLFLRRQVRRLCVACLWLAGYPCLAWLPTTAMVHHTMIQTHRQKHGSLVDLVWVATTLYMFMDGIHAFATLIGVGLLMDAQWKYPPFFGPVEHLLSGRLQDIWGKFWHDLLKTGLLAMSKSILPWKRPRAVWSVARIWLCFVLTGAVHASASYVVTWELRSSLHAGVFYCIQPLGILIQMTLAGALRTVLPRCTISAALLKTVEIATSVLWLRYCFPWISADPALRQAIGDLTPLA
ncbi:hypothetical protein BDW74DRAFT_158686 [Aspergillus multicolor]|uniref:uncharacterized protein n=1 Tax=Aspergillus multicolor TaxID=41759 RepID=UPI003CCCF877